MKNNKAKILITFLFVSSAAAFIYLNTCGLQMAASAELLETGSEMLPSSGSLSDIRIVEFLVEAVVNVFTIR